MPKHTYSLSVRNDSGGTVVASTTTYEDDSESNFAETATAGDTLEIDLPVDVSKIVSFYVYSDKALTLNTNSNLSPDQTFALEAKKPLWWNTDANGANPLTIDVTKLYFDNTLGALDASVKGGFLLNLSV